MVFRIPKTRCILILLLATLIFGVMMCDAHEERVHEAIAKAAVLSSEGMTRFANEVLGSTTNLLLFRPFEFSDSTSLLPVDWVSKGAFNQDYWPRPGNHFYTVNPVRVAGKANGLSDKGETFGILPAPLTNSYAWAAVPDQDTPRLNLNASALKTFNFKDAFFHKPPPPTNDNSWQIARACEWVGLTNSTKAIRDENMAHMFNSLGHILHLNQDSSQPDHTRDDTHALRVSIEDYGGATYFNQPDAFKAVPRGWAYWRDQAHFTKLLDFWDRGFYQGNAAALDADATGAATAKLGLAEFSNGNLLGEDALYAEFFENKSDKTHYFPHPSLKDTDQPQLKTANWANYLDLTTLADGTQGQRPYLKKEGAGRTVNHHSALRYFAAANIGKMATLPARVSVTINETTVLKDYHDVMIPKAIEYSAGILDYFFRGTFVVTAAQNSGQTYFTNKVLNTSGEDFYGGSFLLFEEAAGVRTLLQEFPMTSSLPNNGISNLVYFGSITPANKHLLFYRGSIGYSNSAALDPVDANIAVAIGVSSNVVWHSSFEGGELGDEWEVDSGAVDIVSAAGWQPQEGEFSLDLNAEGPGTISAHIPTASGELYRLSLFYSHNPDGNSNGTPDPSAEISIDSTYLATLHSTTANSNSDMQWQPVSFTFTATSSLTTITFDSLSSSVYGVTLDNLRLTAVGGD